jgi:hypothetical protein
MVALVVGLETWARHEREAVKTHASNDIAGGAPYDRLAGLAARDESGAPRSNEHATLPERKQSSRSHGELRPNGLRTCCSSQQYLFVERADRDSFTLSEPHVEGVRPPKLTCNGHAQRGARPLRSDRDDFMRGARERIENSLDVGLRHSLTRKRPGHLNEKEGWHDNQIDPLERSLHLRARGGVEGFEGSRRCYGDRGIEHEAHYLDES